MFTLTLMFTLCPLPSLSSHSTCCAEQLFHKSFFHFHHLQEARRAQNNTNSPPVFSLSHHFSCALFPWVTFVVTMFIPETSFTRILDTMFRKQPICLPPPSSKMINHLIQVALFHRIKASLPLRIINKNNILQKWPHLPRTGTSFFKWTINKPRTPKRDH